MKTRNFYSSIGPIDYGTWKTGASIFKDTKGYYIVEWNNKTSKEYKKYLKNWKPKDNDFLYLDKIKRKWTKKKPNKYMNRYSPSVSANDYCDKTKKGNDGKNYLSKRNKNGVCRWVKI